MLDEHELVLGEFVEGELQCSCGRDEGSEVVSRLFIYREEKERDRERFISIILKINSHLIVL